MIFKQSKTYEIILHLIDKKILLKFIIYNIGIRYKYEIVKIHVNIRSNWRFPRVHTNHDIIVIICGLSKPIFENWNLHITLRLNQ